jgi:hypothetical protein
MYSRRDDDPRDHRGSIRKQSLNCPNKWKMSWELKKIKSGQSLTSEWILVAQSFFVQVNKKKYTVSYTTDTKTDNYSIHVSRRQSHAFDLLLCKSRLVAEDKHIWKKCIALLRLWANSSYAWYMPTRGRFSLVSERECNCPSGMSSSLRFAHKKHLFISTTTQLSKVTLSNVLSRVGVSWSGSGGGSL